LAAAGWRWASRDPELPPGEVGVGGLGSVPRGASFVFASPYSAGDWVDARGGVEVAVGGPGVAASATWRTGRGPPQPFRPTAVGFGVLDS
jgi:hypothetical protein